MSLNYLGLPIGKNLKKTRLLMLDSTETKICRAYGKIISSQLHLIRTHLPRIYNRIRI